MRYAIGIDIGGTKISLSLGSDQGRILENRVIPTFTLARAEESIQGILATTQQLLNIARNLAYASERINSANSWATFLGKKGKIFILNHEVLKKSCQNKIGEADERKQYVELYLPNTLENIQKEIDQANSELEKGNYEICLSTASKAKADVDVILSVFGVDNSQLKDLLESKLEIVKNNIAR